MSDLLRTGVEWLSDLMEEQIGITVTYVRGEASFDVLAVVGQTAFRITRSYGPGVVVRMRDYLIDAADLATGGIYPPEVGDRIEETLGSDTHIHEVLEPGNGEPAWRWSDEFNQRLRIHTKHIDTEAG